MHKVSTKAQSIIDLQNKKLNEEFLGSKIGSINQKLNHYTKNG